MPYRQRLSLRSLGLSSLLAVESQVIGTEAIYELDVSENLLLGVTHEHVGTLGKQFGGT